MKSEIIEKIRNILAGPTINESQVSHLFGLVRKLLENLPKAERDHFQLLALYCNWALHSKIDRSEQGASILAQIHGIIIDHLKKNDTPGLTNELSNALSLEKLGEQLDEFLRLHADNQRIEKGDWINIVPILAEIISSSPITIASNRGGVLKQLWDRIQTSPIKNGSVVQEIAVVKVTSTIFAPNQLPITQYFCIQITLSDTTKIIVPIKKP